MAVRYSNISPAIAGLALLLGTGAELNGQVAPEPSDTVFELQGVTAEATRSRQEIARIPQAITLVGQDEIQFAERQISLDETLRRVPGVFAVHRHNYTLGEGVRLNIRAPVARLGTRGLQLLQDGIPLTTADGTTLPTNLDLGSAGRIEVIRGPSSVLYGNSAGGVVSVETAFPAEGAFHLSPEIQFGSYGYDRQQVKAEGTVGGVGYVANFNRMQIDGFRDYGAAEIRRMNLVARAFASERTTIRGVFNLYDLPFGENSSSLTREDALENPRSVRGLAFSQGWGKEVTQGQGGITVEHAFSPGHSVRVLGWGMWRDNWNPIPFELLDLHRDAGGVRSEYRGSVDVGLPLSWVTGFDVSLQRDDRLEYENDGVGDSGRAEAGDLLIDQRESVRGLGPFVQLTAALTPSLDLTGGVRYDAYYFSADDNLTADGDQSGNRDLSAASPMVGVTYSARPWLRLYGNIASAYQTPTTVELSNRPDGLGGFNQDLEAEDLVSFEAGIRGELTAPLLRYELSAYTSSIDDGMVPFEGAEEKVFFRNAAEVSRDGVEAAVDWMILPGVQGSVAYTWQDFSYVRYVTDDADYSGNAEPGAPPHSVFAGLSYEAPFGLNAAIDFRWMDEYPVNDANSENTWSHSLVDLRLGTTVTAGGMQLRPFAGVDNLFNERYNASVFLNAFGSRFYEPGPDRAIYVGLTARFGG